MLIYCVCFRVCLSAFSTCLFYCLPFVPLFSSFILFFSLCIQLSLSMSVFHRSDGRCCRVTQHKPACWLWWARFTCSYMYCLIINFNTNSGGLAKSFSTFTSCGTPDRPHVSNSGPERIKEWECCKQSSRWRCVHTGNARLVPTREPNLAPVTASQVDHRCVMPGHIFLNLWSEIWLQLLQLGRIKLSNPSRGQG